MEILVDMQTQEFRISDILTVQFAAVKITDENENPIEKNQKRVKFLIAAIYPKAEISFIGRYMLTEVYKGCNPAFEIWDTYLNEPNKAILKNKFACKIVGKELMLEEVQYLNYEYHN